jgi:hypothetical protein
MATGTELKALYASYADINDEKLAALEAAFPGFVAGVDFNDPVLDINWRFKMFVCYGGNVGALFAWLDEDDNETNFHEVLTDPILSRLEEI